ncbi:MAG: YncE family protein [Kofleriaceae bacterium]
MRWRALTIWLFAGACAGDSALEGGAPSSADAGVLSCLSSNECPTGWSCNDFGQCEPPFSGDGGVPPVETEYQLGQPTSSDRFIYVAMTDQDELVRIDGETLEVRSTPVGESPRVAAAIPDSDGVVVIDSINGTVRIVRPSGPTDAVRVLPTLPNLNRVDLDPSGRFAVIWFDLAKALADGGISGVGSFQDVTVVALADGQESAVDLTVGFRPREVEFDALGTRAYVITQDGVSVIDLDAAISQGPSIVPPIAVADPSVPPEQVEVDIVSTGQYAAVREAGVAALRIVDVGGPSPGQRYELPLASPPSDIDLAPDGSRIYAALREAKQLAIIDVPNDVLAPGSIETIDLSDASVGSIVLSRDGTRALSFTNATLDERVTLIKLDVPGFPVATWPLKKSARALALSPVSDTALIVHAKLPGDPATATSVDDFIDKSYGYSLVDLSTGFAKLQITPVDPGPLAFSPDGGRVYVALDGGDQPTATRAVQIVTTETGVVTTKQLGSAPSAVGILPGVGQAFIAQRHPLGRVSFVHLVNGAVRTVTGFDLNGDVVH